VTLRAEALAMKGDRIAGEVRVTDPLHELRRALDARKEVVVDGEPAARTQQAAALGEESGSVEPVQGRGHGDTAEGPGTEWSVLAQSDDARQAGIGRRHSDHRRCAVHADDERRDGTERGGRQTGATTDVEGTCGQRDLTEHVSAD